MREIRTSGSMSGDGKRSVAAWPKLPRPSSTLPTRTGANERHVRTRWKRKCELKEGLRVLTHSRQSSFEIPQCSRSPAVAECAILPVGSTGSIRQ